MSTRPVLLCFLYFLAICVRGTAQNSPDRVDLKNRVCNLTNIEGRIFQNIKLRYATREILVYVYTDGGGGGSILLTNFSPSTLASLGLTTNQAVIDKFPDVAAQMKSAEKELSKRISV
jgi:hypothetical protein